MLKQVVRGPLLIPHRLGVSFFDDGAIAADEQGVIRAAGPWRVVQTAVAPSVPVRTSDGVILPPLLDVHIHVPQHPIRGRFIDGIPDDAPGGKLLNGLKKNVFPVEAKCARREHAEHVTRQFLEDTLAHGVVGGAAYMTPSAVATEAALEILPETWSVGLVMMNQNCPPDLCTDETTFDADVERIASRFGKRLIMTDRFAVAVNTPLRKRGSELAKRFGLRTQTHLNEQQPEKLFVERTLYPDAESYTDVYRRDGLLDHKCIVAHCVHMSEDEWRILRDTGSSVAHCPTSNLLLGSGVMPLDELIGHGIPYAIATDVGASPTVSMLAEMARFLSVHEGKSTRATPAEALYRATLAAAEILGLDSLLGRLEIGYPMSFVEARPTREFPRDAPADDVIRSLLPDDPSAPTRTVRRVTMNGKVVFEAKDDAHA